MNLENKMLYIKTSRILAKSSECNTSTISTKNYALINWFYVILTNWIKISARPVGSQLVMAYVSVLTGKNIVLLCPGLFAIVGGTVSGISMYG